MRLVDRRMLRAVYALAEHLERHTLLRETWVVDATGDRDTAANWSGAAGPGASDAVTISVRDLNVVNNAAANSGTLRIAASFIELSADKLIPIGLFVPGRLATTSFTVTNNRNVPAKDAVMVQFLAAADDTVAEGVELAEPGVRLNLRANAKIPLHVQFDLPKTLAPGSFCSGC